MWVHEMVFDWTNQGRDKSGDGQIRGGTYQGWDISGVGHIRGGTYQGVLSSMCVCDFFPVKSLDQTFWVCCGIMGGFAAGSWEGLLFFVLFESTPSRRRILEDFFIFWGGHRLIWSKLL